MNFKKNTFLERDLDHEWEGNMSPLERLNNLF
jgi:hypothetical protein